MLRALFAIVAGLALAGDAFAAVDAPLSSRLRTITAKKAIKIAYRTDATPFAYLSPQKEPIGYTIDLCKLVVASIAKEARIDNLKIAWVPVNAHTRFDAIKNRQADIECGSSTISLRRLGDVDFSSVIFVETTGIVVKSDSGIDNVSQLSGKKVAVIADTTNERALETLRKSGKLDAILIPVKDRAGGIAAINDGKADAFASDKLLLVGTDISASAALKMLPDDLSFEPYGIALPRGDWALRLAVNTGLAQAYRNGQAAEVFKKWFAQLGLKPSGLMTAVYQLGALPD
jgi:glutamate/aspartate transport system substrate-binding protein